MVVELKITGMHCAGCVASVENALRKVEGVEEAVVTLTLEKATVLGSVDPTQLIQSVDQTGYSAEIIDGGTGIDIQERKTNPGSLFGSSMHCFSFSYAGHTI